MNEQNEQQKEQFYTIAEVSHLLKLSDKTIRRMIAGGELDAIKIRLQWRIKASSLQKYL